MVQFPFNIRRIGVIVGIIILAFMVLDFNARLEDLNRQTELVRVQRTLATQAIQTQLALQTQVAYAQSDQAVVDYSRGEAHLVQDGDIPVVPVGVANTTPVPTSTPTPVPTPLPNWQTWWNLMFGQ